MSDVETAGAAALPAAAGAGAPGGAAASDARAPRVLTSEALLGGAAAVTIVHDGACYQLRRTRQGKLILTK